MTLQIQAQIKIDTKKLKALPVQIDQAIIRGLQKGAGEVERKAKQYAPYDTGHLFRSIRQERVKRTTDGYSVSIAPHVPYAGRMEEPGRVLRRGRRPYLKPALQNSINKIVSILIKEIKGVIK